jgi:hypothetical protein
MQVSSFQRFPRLSHEEVVAHQPLMTSKCTDASPSSEKEGEKNNNKMERFNGEIRDREKVMRGLKKPETPIIPGYQIYHNYVRPHEALDGKTPAEACGIQVKGENKWLTLIQNASRSQKC